MTGQGHATAILEAQWWIYRNYFRKSPFGIAASTVVGLLWYGLWVGLSTIAAMTIPEMPAAELTRYLPLILMGVFFFWQVFPILLVSTGISLDLRKLRPYPVPLGDLFWLEVLLRVTACVEMLFVTTGVAIGLLQHRAVRWWTPTWLVIFVALNLFLSTGLRDLLARVFARKRFREVISLVVLSLIALPQLLLNRAVSGSWQWTRYFDRITAWPWTALARLAQGPFAWTDFGYTALWVASAFLFARWQFRQTFVFDEETTGVRKSAPRPWALTESFFSLPTRFLPDPLAAITEKELRFLSRSPRFRVLFMMSFSFGLLIFMPSFLRSREQGGFFSSNFLTMVGGYSLVLLAEVLFWNNLGFDRSAVATYFVTPVRFRTVLIAKNIAALCYVSLEIVILTIICRLFRLTVSPAKIFEAFAVLAMLTLFLAAAGNIRSVRTPRPMNPTQAMRGPGAGRANLSMLLLFPLAVVPAALPFGARYAFDSNLAFYLVLVIDMIIGAVVYHIALDSAERAALERQEQLISELSQGEGLVTS